MFNIDLVIVTKEGGDLAGQDISLEDIAAGKYTLAVGDENVPAGNYACQSLTTVTSSPTGPPAPMPRARAASSPRPCSRR